MATLIASSVATLLCLLYPNNEPYQWSKHGNHSSQSIKSLELLSAIKNNDIGKVTQLLAWDIDLNFVVNGQTPIEIALISEKIEIAKLLVAKGANFSFNRGKDKLSLMHECINKNLVLSVSYMLSLKTPIEEKSPNGSSPLIYAVSKGYTEMVKMLVDFGMSVNIRDRLFSTPLQEAARTNNLEMVVFLLKHGADVNAHGQFGYTPIMWGMNNDEIINILIESGADINAKSDSNYTPLHSAVGSLNLNAVKLLIEKGADVSAKDDRGVTPLKITTFHRNPMPDPFPEMALLLKRAGAVE